MSGIDEMEIAIAVVFLKRRAKRFGESGIPFAVKLANGSEEGWRRAAITWIEGNKERAAKGERVRIGGLA